jgi:hypothetical protein
MMQRNLFDATGHWTALTVARVYQNSERGRALLEVETAMLASRGYTPTTSAADGGHVNVGRTVSGAVLTGGLSLLFGGSRESGHVVVTFTRAKDDPMIKKTEAASGPDAMLEQARSRGFASDYRGATMIHAYLRSLSAKGLTARTPVIGATLVNSSNDKIDEVELEVVVAGHTQHIAGLRLMPVGTGESGSVWIPSHEGAQLFTKIVAVRSLRPRETRQVKLIGVILPAGLASLVAMVLPRRVRRGGEWSDPEPVDLMAAVSAAAEADEQEEAKQLVGTKVCPDCAERIKAEARICRFCRYEFAPATSRDQSERDQDAASGPPHARSRGWVPRTPE